MLKLKIVLFTFFFVFLFYLSLFIAGFIPFIAQYKTEFRPELLNEYITNIIFHPIDSINQMLVNQNPLLFVAMGAALLLFVYLIYKTKTKDYENVSDTYGVQGTSRWAKKKEIFKVPEDITIYPAENMLKAIKKTLRS